MGISMTVTPYKEFSSKVLADREHTVCFTGHRPENFPFGEDSTEGRMLKSMLYQSILDAISDGYNIFITGMARGIDIWAGHMIAILKTEMPDAGIKLVGISPFKGDEEERYGADMYEYGTVKNACDEFIYISEHYFPACYHVRNRAMVDNSSLVLGAVYDYKSGTGNTIREAKRQGLEIGVIDIGKCSFFNAPEAGEIPFQTQL